MENWKYLVIDHRNLGVLCSAPTLEVGSALVRGLLDTKLMLLPLHLSWYSQYSHIDFNAAMLRVSALQEVQPLAINYVTDDFLKRRELARIRIQFLHKLQIVCEMARSRGTIGNFPELCSDLEAEIQKCQPGQGVYSLGILEYASIQGIAPATAYQDLKVKLDGARLVRIRNYSIYEKYVDLCGQTIAGDIESLYNRLLDEVYFNALV